MICSCISFIPQRQIFILAIIISSLIGCSGLQYSRKPSRPIVHELIRSTQSWDGSLLPAYPGGQPEITIRRVVIPPGAVLDVHSHPVINAGVLLSGEMKVVTQEGRTFRLKKADPIVEVVNTLHYGINPGKTPAEILVFYAGSVGTPITISDSLKEK